jgi:hypothetical protein
VALGEWDGDGKPDVVATMSDGTVWTLPGDGAGGIAFGSSVGVGANPVSVAVGDLNSDGKLDLVTANSGSNTVSVLLGNGAGGFPSRTDFATGTNPVAVAIGDVNGDGAPDLVSANNAASTVSVLLGLVRTRTTLTVVPTFAALGEAITLTAVVSVPPPGSGAPTDSVRFFDGLTLLGTSPVYGGVAVLGLSTSRLGDRPLTAVYKGDGNLFGSVSNVVTQTVVSSCLPGPVAWWRGEGNANDAVGTHNGTLVGGVTFTTGKVGQAFNLDGSSSYVSVPNDTAFNFTTSEITIEAWIKPVDGMDRYIVTKGEDSFFLAVGPTSYNKPSFFLRGAMPDWLVATTDVVTDHQWHHVAGTRSFDGFIKIYVDGHLENSLFYPGFMFTGSSPVLIGYRPSPTGHYPGLIDELAIYNRALSAAQIHSIFMNGPPGRCGVTAVRDAPATPFAFSPPWPNPSRRATNLDFRLPAPARVRVEVVDVAGRRVTLLLDQALDAGSHSIRWDGRDGTGNAVVPGVYLVRLSTGGVSATRKVVAIR